MRYPTKKKSFSLEKGCFFVRYLKFFWPFLFWNDFIFRNLFYFTVDKKHDNENHCFTDVLFLMRLQKGLDPNNVASQSISCRKILMQCNHDLTNVLSFSFCAEKSFQFRRKLTLNESAQKVVLALVQSYISQVL